MPLTNLSLRGVKQLTDSGLKFLRGVPLRALDLEGCRLVSDSGLKFLRGAPLESLALEPGNYDSSFTDAGLEVLRGMPLTKLSLGGCWRLSPSGLACLRGAPLTSLGLWSCDGLVSNAALEVLRGLPLVEFHMACGSSSRGDLGTELTAAGMDVLASFPLTSLTLDGCALALVLL